MNEGRKSNDSGDNNKGGSNNYKHKKSRLVSNNIH